ncbi:hypothetical protein D777_02412 [Marinobacter nitratireducens]|uniref:Uncharacterized protein n=1 Tax=Marinobacter nitratireducens TaxID=1137280 RepID=A0A072NBL3_9GAMM|nr:hypothetical protein D777_02412 [Marinobacter nitratireducens]
MKVLVGNFWVVNSPDYASSFVPSFSDKEQSVSTCFDFFV